MSLQRHYGALDARERLTVYLSAQERGDEVEKAAVIAAGERLQVSMSDTVPFALALETLGFVHNLAQTELAFAVMTLKQAWGNEPEAFPASRYLARRWVVSERAWREVCAEHGLDYEARASALTGVSVWSHLRLAEIMADLALTGAECEPWVGGAGVAEGDAGAAFGRGGAARVRDVPRGAGGAPPARVRPRHGLDLLVELFGQEDALDPLAVVAFAVDHHRHRQRLPSHEQGLGLARAEQDGVIDLVAADEPARPRQVGLNIFRRRG